MQGWDRSKFKKLPVIYPKIREYVVRMESRICIAIENQAFLGLKTADSMAIV